MATVKKIEGKRGVSYKITVSQGRDSAGRQIRHYKTWTPPPGMTARQAEKEAQKIALSFEESFSMGLRPDDRRTFEEYAAYFIATKRRSGLRESTLETYGYCLTRICEAIGKIPVVSITPHHLNLLWEQLSQREAHGRKAVAKAGFIAAARRYSLKDLAESSGLTYSMTSDALKGRPISEARASDLASSLGYTLEEAFSFVSEACTLSASTIRSYATIVSSVLTLAVKEGLIPANPVTRSTLPCAPRTEAEHLEPEQISALLSALEKEPEQWQVLILFVLSTGCRRGEALALRWSKIDFPSGTVCIDRSLFHTAAGGTQEGPTKSGRPRTIALPTEMLQLLKRHQLYQAQLCLALGDMWTGTEDYAFTRSNGACMSPDYMTMWFRRFLSRHGLPDVHLHTLRHTAASFLLSSGVDIAEVSRRLGHANITTTLNIYTHALESADRKAADALGRLVFSV